MGIVGSMVSYVIFANLSLGQDPTPATDQVAIRAGLTLLILLIALLLGPRIARSVGQVPALIETARERRATRLNGANGNGASGHSAEREDGSEEDATTLTSVRRSRWLGGVVLVCIWVFAFYLIAVIWFADNTITPPDQVGLLHALREIALNLGISVLIIIVTLVVARALQTSLVSSLYRGRINRNLVLLAGRVIFTVTIIVGVVAILGVWGLGIALPVTLVGALTVALSFALQDILKNLVSGVYLLLERPFVIGDRITVATYTGVIENISIRVTALRTSGGERVLVPNGMLFSSAVVNNSFYQRRRIGLLVTTPDDGPDAISTARGKILQTLEGLDYVLPAPAPEVALSKASGGKVELRAIFWLSVADGEEGAGRLSAAMEQVRAHLPDAEVAPLDPALAD
ncbi:MAG TPA: mechanosensitive ion channel family protein [Ktedonobacterales bacterium]|nr:mechanosensitive ion channel family protein [Ktedonobacterales bacterium]